MINVPNAPGGEDPAAAPSVPVLPEVADQPEAVAPGGVLVSDQPEPPTPEEPVQVAGVAGAIKGLFGKMFGKSERAASQVPPAAVTPPPATATPTAPPTPPTQTTPTPTAPAPAVPKTGVSLPLPSEGEASAVAAEMRRRGPYKDSKNPTVKPRVIEPGRTEYRNFRSDTLNTVDNIKALIDNVAESAGGFQEARRGVQTNADTAAAAEKYTINDLLRRAPAEAWNAEQLLAGKEILLELSDRIHKTARLIDTAKGTPGDMLEFRKLLATHQAVQETFQGAVSEAGRALQIMQAVTAPGGRLRHKQILDALDASGGEGAARKLAEAIMDAGGDPAMISKIAAKGWKANTIDTINEIRINGMLSGPTTQVVNAGSNALSALLQVPERAVAGVFGKMHDGEKVVLGEQDYLLYGLLSGWQDAFRVAGKAWRDGVPADSVSKLENNSRAAISAANYGMDPLSNSGKAVDLLGAIIRLPGRAMITTDELFKAINYRGEVAATAARTAVSEGLKMGSPEFNTRVAQLIADPSDEIKLSADSAAKYLTFQDSLSGPGLLDAMGRGGMQVQQNPLGKLVFTFVRTPINIAKYTLERTPMAPLTAKFHAALEKGGAEGDLAMARFTMGTMASILIAAQAQTGLITGSGPSDPNLRSAREAAGWKPYSILIDGKYVSYNRLDPLGSIIGATADAIDIMQFSKDEATATAVTSAVAMGFANAMASKTYVRGLSDLLDVIGNPEREKALYRYGASQATTFMPYSSLSNFLEKAVPVAAGAMGMADTSALGGTAKSSTVGGDALSVTINMFKSKIPGLSSDVPPDTDFWGQVIDPGAGSLSPVQIAPATQADMATQEVIENKIVISKPSARISVPLGKRAEAPVDLLALDKEGWLYAEYKRLVGTKAHELVTAETESSDWSDLTPGPQGQKAKRIRAAFDRARTEAILELVENRPGVAEAARTNFESTNAGDVDPLPAHMFEAQ